MGGLHCFTFSEINANNPNYYEFLVCIYFKNAAW